MQLWIALLTLDPSINGDAVEISCTIGLSAYYINTCSQKATKFLQKFDTYGSIKNIFL